MPPAATTPRSASASAPLNDVPRSRLPRNAPMCSRARSTSLVPFLAAVLPAFPCRRTGDRIGCFAFCGRAPAASPHFTRPHALHQAPPRPFPRPLVPTSGRSVPLLYEQTDWPRTGSAKYGGTAHGRQMASPPALLIRICHRLHLPVARSSARGPAYHPAPPAACPLRTRCTTVPPRSISRFSPPPAALSIPRPHNSLTTLHCCRLRPDRAAPRATAR